MGSRVPQLRYGTEDIQGYILSLVRERQLYCQERFVLGEVYGELLRMFGMERFLRESEEVYTRSGMWMEQMLKNIILYFGFVFVAIMFVGFLVTVVHVYKEYFKDIFRK